MLWLTVFGAVQYLGTLVSPLFGVAGDRLGHRNVLFGMRVTYAMLAAVLMALAFAGAVTPLLVLIIATLAGLVRPSDLGVRGALVAETMPNERLIGAMSIARTTSDSARVAGALAGAGVFALFGMGPAYVVITCFYVTGALFTLGIAEPRRHVSLAMTPDDPHLRPGATSRPASSHVWNTPILLAIVWLAFLANLTAFPLTNGLMPYVVRDVYRAGPDMARLSGGELRRRRAGRLDRAEPRRRQCRAAAHDDRRDARSGTRCCWPSRKCRARSSAMVCLLVAGFMQSFCMVPLSIILLRAAGEKFRGRVMGVRMMAIYSLPLGLLAAGPLIDWVGFRATASLYANDRPRLHDDHRAALARRTVARLTRHGARRRIFFSSAGIGNSSTRAPDMPVISRVARWNVR